VSIPEFIWIGFGAVGLQAAPMLRQALLSLVVVLVVFSGRAIADSAADRAAIADAAVKLSANATSLAKSANGSDDRAVRKKFAPRVTELSDDLSALARRVRKDIGLDAIAKDALDIAKDAAELVNLADEAEEKEERKSLRAQAQLLEQGISAMRTNVETVAARTDKKPAAPPVSNKPAAMAADSYNQFVAAVKGASFDKGKLDMVAQGAASNYFTSAQVAGLMATFSFDDGKIDAAVACWNKIVDPENNFVVFTKLQFDSSKEKLRKRVGK
jgi:Domain of unknown function (DUF4476)